MSAKAKPTAAPTLVERSDQYLERVQRRIKVARGQAKKSRTAGMAEYLQSLNSIQVTLGFAIRDLSAAIDFAKMADTDGPYEAKRR